jgi:alkylhydroperoxidase family enzyme
MPTYLSPIEKPTNPMLRLLYWLMRRQTGKVPGWLTVFSARMPLAFTTWMSKPFRLDKKLTLPAETVALVRARVNGINTCTACMDAARWYAITKTPHLLPRLDALEQYRSSPLFTDTERAALDYASELTEHKHVSPVMLAQLAQHYGEREICELAWVVSSNHLVNINNGGLGLGSDGLCDLAADPAARQKRQKTTAAG